MDLNQTDAEKPAAPALDPEDYYFEGPYMVFTAQYHLKRGSCCGSGCRHCPYGLAGSDSDGKAGEAQGTNRPTEGAVPPAAG